MPTEPATRDSFSITCPKCRSTDIWPVTQQNNFDSTNAGGSPTFGASHVTTSREYECQKCSHRWGETVPHSR